MLEDTPQRRGTDPRIDALVTDVALLKVDMAANTAVTTQVRDILTSFRLMAAAAKWIAAIGGGLMAIWHGFDMFTKRGG